MPRSGATVALLHVRDFYRFAGSLDGWLRAVDGLEQAAPRAAKTCREKRQPKQLAQESTVLHETHAHRGFFDYSIRSGLAHLYQYLLLLFWKVPDASLIAEIHRGSGTGGSGAAA